MYFVKEQYSRGRFDGVNKIAAVIDADIFTELPEYNNCKGVDGELTLGTIAFVADEDWGLRRYGQHGAGRREHTNSSR